MVIFLHPARQAFSTVTTLEYLQPVGAFSPVLGAHLTFLRTGLQILDQKCLAQHSPAAQSDERRQTVPSCARETIGKVLGHC